MYCRKCGKENLDVDLFCGQCGESLNQQSIVYTPAQQIERDKIELAYYKEKLREERRENVIKCVRCGSSLFTPINKKTNILVILLFWPLILLTIPFKRASKNKKPVKCNNCGSEFKI